MDIKASQIRCNCCNRTVRDIKSDVEGLSQECTISILFRTTRNAFVCENCVVTNTLVTYNNSQPHLVYDKERKKYKGSEQLTKLYKQENRLDIDAIYDAESHNKYDLSAKVKGVTATVAEPSNKEKVSENKSAKRLVTEVGIF